VPRSHGGGQWRAGRQHAVAHSRGEQCVACQRRLRLAGVDGRRPLAPARAAVSDRCRRRQRLALRVSVAWRGSVAQRRGRRAACR
jgi:hypothetical protein